MALLGDLFGAGGIANLAGKVVDVVKGRVPDINAQKALQGELEKALLEHEFDLDKGQQDINKIEAANPSLFVSGWRPAAGWVCVLGIAYQFVLHPIFVWGSANFGIVAPPTFDSQTIMGLLSGLLGLGGYRTFERFKGVHNK
jgi:hypothetical protein